MVINKEIVLGVASLLLGGGQLLIGHLQNKQNEEALRIQMETIATNQYVKLNNQQPTQVEQATKAES